jgi:hypothetical protein
LIAMIVDSLPPCLPLYKYAVDWYVNHWTLAQAELSQQKQTYEVLSKEFMHLVLCKLLIRTQITNSDTQALCTCCHCPCEYHEHITDTDWLDSESLHL